ncbi:unnamed protein product [Angiostrongylus costaricensis]|uniref:Protein kinase domain-containing protein n=1 Tax=Angiostrongylus costaricensis TaxID=334426 RepID=A0A158PFY1_ANGCS|nr:unnamed protein product [Angiostrongylus costaricensis]
MSHTVSSTCNVPFYDRPQTPLNLLPYIENAQAHTLVKDGEVDLSLLSRANLSFALNSLNSLFVHFSYNTTEVALEKIEMRLWLDARFDLLGVSPLSSDVWSLRVISAVRPLFYTSFICRRKKKTSSWDGYVFALLLRMRGSISENKRLLRNEEGDEEVIHKVATKFRVLPDSIYALVPVAKVYVDGSELRGMQNIKVHMHFEKWTTFVSFTVWYPQLPITLWLGDAVLNSISGWPITVWKNLQGDRHYKGTAKQFACGNRFQQTELRVFASFQVSDERTGERMYLSGRRDVMFDVTSLAADRVVVKAQTPNIELGSALMMVSTEMVTVLRLAALPVVEMNVNIEPTAGKRSQYDVVVAVDTTFHHRYQHGSFLYQLFYSDDTVEFLDDVSITDYILSSQSSDERVLALAHKAQNGVDMIALDDLSDPLVELELRPPVHCTDIDALPLATLKVALRIQFDGQDSNRLAAVRYATNATLSPQLPEVASIWRMDSVLAVILILVLFVGVSRFLTKKATYFKGYEKLVAPLLSRLSSSSSGCERDEDSKEWVWLGKTRNDTNSIGSRCSQPSTINVIEESPPSYDENTQASISYRGSEISVFISPTPVVTVSLVWKTRYYRMIRS